MIAAILITALITGALAYAFRPGRYGEMIVSRPYNNRYNDASGARDESYGLGVDQAAEAHGASPR
jgi:hypothetical protein